MKRKYKRRRKKKNTGKTLLLIIILGIFSIFVYNTLNDKNIEEKRKSELDEQKRIAQQKTYENCLNDPNKNYTSEENAKQISVLTSYLKKFNISLNYSNLNYGFEVIYNENTVYYGASLIKLLDALYIYESAVKGTIDLNTKLTYEDKYKAAYSLKMSKLTFGTKVTLKDLIDYALSFSDNSAHFMLYDFIGYTNLKNYARSIGLTTVLNRQDKFGEFTSKDAMILIKYLYHFVEKNEIANDIINSMTNDYYNSLSLNNVKVIHKYGEYEEYYHDIGITYVDSPYAIAILSQLGKYDYKSIFNNIQQKVNEINSKFIEDKQNNCKSIAFSK